MFNGIYQVGEIRSIYRQHVDLDQIHKSFVQYRGDLLQRNYIIHRDQEVLLFEFAKRPEELAIERYIFQYLQDNPPGIKSLGSDRCQQLDQIVFYEEISREIYKSKLGANNGIQPHFKKRVCKDLGRRGISIFKHCVRICDQGAIQQFISDGFFLTV